LSRHIAQCHQKKNTNNTKKRQDDSQKQHDDLQKQQDDLQKTLDDLQKNQNESQKHLYFTNDKNIVCNYCNKTFTRKNNMIRHIDKYCKIKKKIDEDKENIFNKLLEEMSIIKQQNKKIIKENMDIKKENKHLKNNIVIKKNNTTNNTINNTTNNTQINNNIQLVAFGKEDLSQIDDKVVSVILKKGFMSVPKLIEYIHFNKNNPENHNIYIPNLTQPYSIIFNGIKWNVMNRDEILDQLYDEKNHFLEIKFRELEKTLGDVAVKKFGRYLESNDEKFVKNKIMDEAKLILYNKKNIPIETKKKYIKDDNCLIKNN
jgi:regulator of replication initiation timing